MSYSIGFTKQEECKNLFKLIGLSFPNELQHMHIFALNFDVTSLSDNSSLSIEYLVSLENPAGTKEMKFNINEIQASQLLSYEFANRYRQRTLREKRKIIKAFTAGINSNKKED